MRAELLSNKLPTISSRLLHSGNCHPGKTRGKLTPLSVLIVSLLLGLRNGMPPPTVFIHARQAVPSDHVVEVDWFRDQPVLGWRNYNSDFIVEEINIEGDHFSIFKTENVSSIHILFAYGIAKHAIAVVSAREDCRVVYDPGGKGHSFKRVVVMGLPRLEFVFLSIKHYITRYCYLLIVIKLFRYRVPCTSYLTQFYNWSHQAQFGLFHTLSKFRRAVVT